MLKFAPFFHLLFVFNRIGNIRSISALDSAAVQRARARQQYSMTARLKVTAGTASLRKYLLYQSRFNQLKNLKQC